MVSGLECWKFRSQRNWSTCRYFVAAVKYRNLFEVWEESMLSYPCSVH
jgi:hypothetical protein